MAMAMKIFQRGGARLDGFNASYPFATLKGDRHKLILACMGKEYVFHKGSIRRLSIYNGILSIGLRIEHRIPGYPSFVVFWVALFPWKANMTRLKGQLQQLGYAVCNS